jgi:N6-L-threonylcarbamoyladenine synthase
MALFLGIETSCDDTGISLYNSSTHVIYKSLVFSQIAFHKKYGGVIPELASMYHLEAIDKLFEEVFHGTPYSINDVDYIASTVGPGLPGSLLIGSVFAKTIAYIYKKPFIGINHLEGHIYSVGIEHDLKFPFLCLSVSGGHTSIYLVKNYVEYIELCTTLDDAAGELFDKISKLLNLGYPGGVIIEQLAEKNNFKYVRPYPELKKNELYLSFSGIKTAVLYDIMKLGFYDFQNSISLPMSQELVCDIASSLLYVVSKSLISRLELAFNMHPEIEGIAFVGGVACNKYIKNNMQAWADKKNKKLWVPSKEYCTDNAAMIAYIAQYRTLNASYKTDIYT